MEIWALKLVCAAATMILALTVVYVFLVIIREVILPDIKSLLQSIRIPVPNCCTSGWIYKRWIVPRQSKSPVGVERRAVFVKARSVDINAVTCAAGDLFELDVREGERNNGREGPA